MKDRREEVECLRVGAYGTNVVAAAGTGIVALGVTRPPPQELKMCDGRAMEKTRISVKTKISVKTEERNWRKRKFASSDGPNLCIRVTRSGVNRDKLIFY